MLLPNQIRLRRFEFPIDICPKTDIIYMKSDIKEAVMNCESARKYAYLSAEITSLYHEAAVKIGVSDTVLDILYVLCEQEGQCLQSDLSEAGGRPEYIGLFDRKGAGFFCSKSPPTIPD